MFSRRAPMHPQNVMKNMTTPTTMRMTAGSTKNVSRTVSVRERGERNSPRLHVGLLLHVSSGFSFHIHFSSEDWLEHRSGITKQVGLIPLVGVYRRLQIKYGHNTS